MDKLNIHAVVEAHRSYFDSGKSKDIAFRVDMLKRLRDAIVRYEDKICSALWSDLHKSKAESYITEISIVLQELDYHIKSIKKWTRVKKVRLPITLFPSYGRIIKEPLGVALIIAPWNYPFQLLMNPLIGAISAGCCALLRPSPYTPNTSKVMCEIVKECFDQEYISIIEGGRSVNEEVLAQRYDTIFFTGSPSFGKSVMRAAAENLTPLVLELGGKSPCIVDKDANIDIACRRIVMGKFINAGQTCIAPDYLFVHKDKKEELVASLILQIENVYGENAFESGAYPRIVNDAAVDRLAKLLDEGVIRMGGEVRGEERYISPTIIDCVLPDHKIMKEEIFGPILPIMTFGEIGECVDYINKREKPLALYYFGGNSKLVLAEISSGGGCVNDTLMHIASHKMPFGGVGNSGMGKYHGYESFEAFTNIRSIVYTPTWIDLPFRYPPFRYFKYIKKLL